jgi:AcrR family transcriptional regulator
MTVTPWGNVERLRERRLPPGPSKNRERVVESQRARLVAAMVSVVAEKGYGATRVADVLEAAAVSRSTFYKLFEIKHECFLAALDAIGALAGPTVFDVYDRTPGTWDERLAAMLDALAVTIESQPAAARVAWVEVYAAGSDAVERVELIDDQVEKIIRAALAESPEHEDAPREAVRAVIGGLRTMVHVRVRTGRVHELRELVPELLEWIRTYRTPPERLRRPRKPPAGLVPSTGSAREPRERLLAAVTELVAEDGYPTMTISRIAGRAGVSLSTFYDCFDGKEAAFIGAIERARRLMLEATARAFTMADDWPRRIAAGTHALTALFTVDAPLARLGGAATYEGSDDALDSRDAGLAESVSYLDYGYELYPDTPRIAAEAVGATVYALLSDHVRRRGSDSLYELAPLSTFLVLAPFVGAAEATRIANEPVAVPEPRDEAPAPSLY